MELRRSRVLLCDPERGTAAARSETELRLELERSMRDVAFSRQTVIDTDAEWVMNTGSTPTAADVLLDGRPCVRIDNTHLPAHEVAERVVRAFGLPAG